MSENRFWLDSLTKNPFTVGDGSSLYTVFASIFLMTLYELCGKYVLVILALTMLCSSIFDINGSIKKVIRCFVGSFIITNMYAFYCFSYYYKFGITNLPFYFYVFILVSCCYIWLLKQFASVLSKTETITLQRIQNVLYPITMAILITTIIFLIDSSPFIPYLFQFLLIFLFILLSPPSKDDTIQTSQFETWIYFFVCMVLPIILYTTSSYTYFLQYPIQFMIHTLVLFLGPFSIFLGLLSIRYYSWMNVTIDRLQVLKIFFIALLLITLFITQFIVFKLPFINQVILFFTIIALLFPLLSYSLNYTGKLIRKISMICILIACCTLCYLWNCSLVITSLIILGGIFFILFFYNRQLKYYLLFISMILILVFYSLQPIYSSYKFILQSPIISYIFILLFVYLFFVLLVPGCLLQSKQTVLINICFSMVIVLLTILEYAFINIHIDFIQASIEIYSFTFILITSFFTILIAMKFYYQHIITPTITIFIISLALTKIGLLFTNSIKAEFLLFILITTYISPFLWNAEVTITRILSHFGLIVLVDLIAVPDIINYCINYTSLSSSLLICLIAFLMTILIIFYEFSLLSSPYSPYLRRVTIFFIIIIAIIFILQPNLTVFYSMNKMSFNSFQTILLSPSTLLLIPLLLSILMLLQIIPYSFPLYFMFFTLISLCISYYILSEYYPKVVLIHIIIYSLIGIFLIILLDINDNLVSKSMKTHFNIPFLTLLWIFLSFLLLLTCYLTFKNYPLENGIIYTTQTSIFLIVTMACCYSLVYYIKFRMIIKNNETRSSTFYEVDSTVKKSKTLPTTINNLFICFTFIILLVGCCVFPSLRDFLLLLPLLLVLLDYNVQKESTSWITFIVSKYRLLIIPFVGVCIIQFIFEIMDMKASFNKPNANLIYYLVTDRKVRRIREILMFIAATPSYYSAMCLSSGVYHLSDVFVIIFGILCIVGLFAETNLVKIYSFIGLLSSVVQYLYVKLQERESLKYI